MRTQYYTATSLDGFIADSDNSLDWLHVQQRDPAGPLNYDEFVAEVGAIAMGPIEFASGDVEPVHEQMVASAGGRNVWIVGGGDLAGQFADAGLLDEVIAWIAPVMLGGGAPLLPRRIDLRLEELARNGDFACARFIVVR